MSSFLVVPLIAGGKGIGIITLVGCHGRHIGPDDVDLAVDLGRRAGAAVEKIRLYAQLHEDNWVLQSSLLPANLPDIPGVTLSRTTDPAPRASRSAATSTTCSAPGGTGGGWFWATCGQGAGRGSPHRGRPLHRARGGP